MHDIEKKAPRPILCVPPRPARAGSLLPLDMAVTVVPNPLSEIAITRRRHVPKGEREEAPLSDGRTEREGERGDLGLKVL